MTLDPPSTTSPLLEIDGPPVIVPGDIIITTYNGQFPLGTFANLYLPYLVDECELLSVHVEILRMDPVANYFNMVSSGVVVASESLMTILKTPRPTPYKNAPLIQASFNNTMGAYVGSSGECPSNINHTHTHHTSTHIYYPPTHIHTHILISIPKVLWSLCAQCMGRPIPTISQHTSHCSCRGLFCTHNLRFLCM